MGPRLRCWKYKPQDEMTLGTFEGSKLMLLRKWLDTNKIPFDAARVANGLVLTRVSLGILAHGDHLRVDRRRWY
jgi:hypothetical protein